MARRETRAAAAVGPGRLAELACIAEVTARKAGNVHPRAAFDDASWMDFAVSAVAIAPILDATAERGVGVTILECVRATRDAIGHNTNLGMILLLAPLSAVPPSRKLRPGVHRVLAALTPADAEAVYEAIRLANPGGLGSADEGDVRDPPRLGLLEAMRLAAGRDAIARQYASGFADVFNQVAPDLAAGYAGGEALDAAIVAAHLRQMAREPDTLIARKCGAEVAGESQRRAAAVLAAGGPGTAAGRRAFARLDRWLRADGRRRNPGASADLIAAGLFVVFREGRVEPPWRWAGSVAVD